MASGLLHRGEALRDVDLVDLADLLDCATQVLLPGCPRWRILQQGEQVGDRPGMIAAQIARDGDEIACPRVLRVDRHCLAEGSERFMRHGIVGARHHAGLAESRPEIGAVRCQSGPLRIGAGSILIVAKVRLRPAQLEPGIGIAGLGAGAFLQRRDRVRLARHRRCDRRLGAFIRAHASERGEGNRHDQDQSGQRQCDQASPGRTLDCFHRYSCLWSVHG